MRIAVTDISISAPRRSWSLLSTLKRACQHLIAVMAGDDELKIWQAVDRTGRFYWATYDPISGHRSRFDSEVEVGRWLEERYHRYY